MAESAARSVEVVERKKKLGEGTMAVAGWTFSIVTFSIQVVLLILFGIFADYNQYETPTVAQWSAGAPSNSVQFYHPVFQDVHVMVFIGFGFLMTFLKKYSFGAVGYNMFIAALVLQWATLMGTWMHHAFSDMKTMVKVDLKTMIASDFAAAAVLITFGAVLGKVSRLQLVIIGMIETVFFFLNESILVNFLNITDAGGSIVIHMFGAYFGLAVSRMIHNENISKENDKEESVYHSDVFAMIGTVFLWIFWPSFNGAMLGPGSGQNRAYINTYFSLAACCVTTFVVSPLVDKKRRLDMVHVQNATLAGGVAVGTCADLVIRPWGAIMIGMTAGILSTLGYAFITPLLSKQLKIHDTCGVHNLHGMPAILGACAGAVTASLATFEVYGRDLFTIWAARTPVVNSTFYNQLVSQHIHIGKEGIGRDAAIQGGMQAAAMVITLAISIVGGLLTGLLVRYIDAPKADQLYDDEKDWIVPAEEDHHAGESGLLMAEVKNEIA